jgi:hypothetical protein
LNDSSTIPTAAIERNDRGAFARPISHAPDSNFHFALADEDEVRRCGRIERKISRQFEAL